MQVKNYKRYIFRRFQIIAMINPTYYEFFSYMVEEKLLISGQILIKTQKSKCLLNPQKCMYFDETLPKCSF